MTDHNADTVKLPPPVNGAGAVTSPAFTAPGEGVPVDADGDGAQDRVGVDDTGPAGRPDGLVDRQVPVEVMRAPGGRRVRVAVLGYADPEPALPRLPDVIRTNSEYDVSAVTRPLNDAIARVTGNWKRWKKLFIYATPILCVACIAFGWWWRGAVFAAPLPAGTTRSVRVLDALYRQGYVPPVAQNAARKALVEDGAGDPEGGGR